MYAILDELVGPTEQLGCNQDDRGSTITDFFVLLSGQVHKYLAGWVLHVQEGKYCSAVVGDCNILSGISNYYASNKDIRSVRLYRPPSSYPALTAQRKS